MKASRGRRGQLDFCAGNFRRLAETLAVAAEGNKVQRGLFRTAVGERLWQEHVKCAAAALTRLDPDPPAMLCDNVFAYRQP